MKETSAPRASGSRGPLIVSAGDLGDAVERVAGEIALVGAHGVHPQLGEEVDRGAQADGLRDVRRAGLELAGHLRPADLVEVSIGQAPS